MALSSTALVTLDDAKAFIKKTDDADLAVLEQIIEGVSTLFNKITERILASATYTAEKFESEGWPDLWLPQRPITALTSITEDGTLLVSGTDYYAYLTEGRIRRMASIEEGIPGNWTTKPQAIVITYTAGYVVTGASPTIPGDLKLAAMIQIADGWTKFLHKSWGETTRSVASQSVSVVETDILEIVETTLRRYKRWSA